MTLRTVAELSVTIRMRSSVQRLWSPQQCLPPRAGLTAWTLRKAAYAHPKAAALFSPAGVSRFADRPGSCSLRRCAGAP